MSSALGQDISLLQQPKACLKSSDRHPRSISHCSSSKPKPPMNLAHSPLKLPFSSLFLSIIICAFQVRADFNPIALTSSSFNADVVVERTSPGPIGRAPNASMDGGTNNSGASWYE